MPQVRLVRPALPARGPRVQQVQLAQPERRARLVRKDLVPQDRLGPRVRRAQAAQRVRQDQLERLAQHRRFRAQLDQQAQLGPWV